MKKIIFTLIVLATLVACQKNEPDSLFDKNPSERFEESQAELRKELTTAQQGWKLTYFTKEGVFGGYHFLMKFTPEGLVTMVSDFNSSTISPTTSKYEIQEGQGTMLAFTTKNYIHELADAMQGIRGKGYAGEFEFIYYGKEGNKLKFKTQRKSTEQFVYFEPATAQDWTDITTLSSNLSTLVENMSNYYMKVTANGTSTDYEIGMQNGLIGVAPLNSNTPSLASTMATKTGVAFKPALTIQGKKFTELTRDDSTTPPTYKATVDGVTAEVYFSLTPPDVFVTDDYKDVNTKIVAFILLTDEMKKYTNITSTPFYENVLKVNSTTDFTRTQLVFQGTKCLVALGYNFSGTEAYYTATFDYELRNKRLYLKNKAENTLSAQWQAPANSTVLQRARSAMDYFANIASDGFYVTKLSKRIGRYTNPAYTLQSANTPENNIPYYAQMR
ncbi:PF14135 domain protein [Capnocytophaga sp. oral taxon 412 str. F0487]|jgi:hypothetical protein|uniref:DUF4302 domain-containing protein n=1 Tax=unclassified Capnocytophaga TaxID=2640652 RepID=UPI0002696886|nr:MULTISPECIES: DUF4302 domain-containing protein [unclassified Capnocytophaga]ALC97625.1 hypothetical protein AM608_08195 [Capnocytophaga sp. oral taxon 323]EIW92798.1 PF14135 domain protein [Capnocytophaga sp. oral taxon 412 str. F0487]